MQFCVVVHTVERYRSLAAEAAFQKVSIKMHSSSKNKDHTNFRYRPTSRLLLSTLIPKMWKLTSYVMFQTLDYTVCKNHQKCLIFNFHAKKIFLSFWRKIQTLLASLAMS